MPTLLDYDPGMLAIIAHRWDVDLQRVAKHDQANVLATAMLDPARTAREWSRLTDQERGALQTLLGAPEHKMPEAQFSRIFGEIRQVGPGKRDREKPHLQPASIAETLFYRGLIARAFDESKTGMQAFIYVPADLAAALPSHETGFQLNGDVPEGSAAEPAAPLATGPQDVYPATTMLVDDLTTLLAYLQVAQAPAEKDALYTRLFTDLGPHWLGGDHPARVALLVNLAGGMGLAASEGGVLKPVPTNARGWLDQGRPRQVRALAEAWRESTLFNDLWHTPGLQPEDTGWRNDPLLARQIVLTYLEMVPPHDWWPIERLIDAIRTDDPDFQRPAGEYDSWYIRDAATGEYLQGFETWDRVDGAVLRFILTGPMHWLGLLDLGDDGVFGRLTVYGRAVCGETDWPDPPDERTPATIEPDGTILAARAANRYERFQLARITDWREAGDPYVYALSAGSLQRAAKQGLKPDAIQAFLKRASGDAVPEPVTRMLTQWGAMGKADVWLSQAVILRTTTPESLNVILETPELRRYVGATLGPTAVVVRAGQENDLVAALQQRGILVEREP
ncbi:helicase-associated domain-containing protein [Aggregatilinea lenta]|uniref:helicase-associated domain-containing protein n=1 Tax=Aggregatilinea lenta TaxID=913108 RepID=UPI0013C31090|nr:helicase-associated domain-containing protein [Aggregatilinea lenta]